MTNASKSFPIKNFTFGYWFGGVLCILSILSLSLGISTVIKSVRKNHFVLTLPGLNVLDLQFPGSYVGIGIMSGLSSSDIEKINYLSYSLTDQNEKENFSVIKIPPYRQYATDRKENQIPLFQFVIDNAGKYILTSSYPYNLTEPKIQIFIVHTDVGYVRTELIVSILVFIVLGILGIYIIRKTYKTITNHKSPALS